MSVRDNFSSDEEDSNSLRIFNRAFRSKRSNVQAEREQAAMANRRLGPKREGKSFVDAHSKGILAGLIVAGAAGAAAYARKRGWLERFGVDSRPPEKAASSPLSTETRKRSSRQRSEDSGALTSPTPSEAALHPARKQARLDKDGTFEGEVVGNEQGGATRRSEEVSGGQSSGDRTNHTMKQARTVAGHKGRQETEAAATAVEEEKAGKDAVEKLQREGKEEAKQEAEAEEKAKQEAEQKAKGETEEKVQREAEGGRKQEAKEAPQSERKANLPGVAGPEVKGRDEQASKESQQGGLGSADAFKTAQGLDAATGGARVSGEEREKERRSSSEAERQGAQKGAGDKSAFKMSRTDTQLLNEALPAETQVLADKESGSTAIAEEPGDGGSHPDARDHGTPIKSRSSSLKSSSGSARGTPKLERKVSFVDGAVPGKDDSRTMPKAPPASQQGRDGCVHNAQNDNKEFGTAAVANPTADADALDQGGAEAAEEASAKDKHTKSAGDNKDDGVAKGSHSAASEVPAATPQLERRPSKQEVVESIAKHFVVAAPHTTSFTSEIDVLNDLSAEYEEAGLGGNAETNKKSLVAEPEEPKQEAAAAKVAGPAAVDDSATESGGNAAVIEEGETAASSDAGTVKAAQGGPEGSGSKGAEPVAVDRVAQLQDSDATQTESGSEAGSQTQRRQANNSKSKKGKPSGGGSSKKKKKRNK